MTTPKALFTSVKALLALMFVLIATSPRAKAQPNLPFGQVTTGDITSAAQTNKYSFTANQGDVIDFTVYTTSGSLDPFIQVFTAGSLTPFASAENTFIGCEGGPVELNSVTLPVSSTGVYDVWISDCNTTNTGNYSIYAQRVNNPTGANPLQLDHTEQSNISSATNSDTYTLSGTAGEVLDFSAIATGSGSLIPRFRFYNPDGSLLASAENTFIGCSGGELEMNNIKLPKTGTYTLMVGDCNDINTGNYSLFVQSTNMPAGNVTDVLWGEVQDGAVNAVGGLVQETTYAFQGTAGDQIDLTVAPTGNLDPRVQIFNPDGSLFASAENTFIGCSGGTLQMNNLAIKTTGKYIVFIDDCNHVNAGTYTLSTQCAGTCLLPAPVISSISPNTAPAGSSGLTLTVNGSNFVQTNAQSVVQWNGVDLPTPNPATFSTTQLKVAVPQSLLVSAGEAQVTVFTPSPGGGTSNAANFIVFGVPSISAWPAAGAITYGQTLASSMLTGGMASVTGAFKWASPATQPPVGTSPHSVIFYPTDSIDYSTVTGPVSVTVNKAMPSCTSPTPSPITYGQTLASSTLTGGLCQNPYSGAAVPGTWAWATPSTAPKAGMVSENLTFAPTDTSDYTPATASVTVTVNKATPTVSPWPSAGPITYGQTLASSPLTGGAGSVQGAFAWTAPNTQPGAGTPSESVTFTPNDASDYSTVTGLVMVTVNKATPTVSAWPTASAITYGQSLASSALTGGSATVPGGSASVPGSFAWTAPATLPKTGTPSESVTFTPTDANDYNTVIGSVAVTVNMAAPNVTMWPAATSIDFGQTLASSKLGGGKASVPGVFTWTTPSTQPSTGTPQENVTFTPTDTADYNTAAGSVAVTVFRTAPACTWPTASTITYPQSLASSILTGGSCTNPFSGASVPGSFVWTSSSTVPVPGTASEGVTFKPTDLTDYKNASGSVSVLVNEPQVATPAITPAAGSYGSGIVVTITDATAGAAIYYTTDGTPPSLTSNVYKTPFLLTASATVQAIAAAPNFSNSNPASSAYIVAGSPTVLILPATNITATGGTLPALVNGGGLGGTVSFAYGTSSTNLSSTTPAQTLSPSSSGVTFQAAITGLSSKTTYYYQAVVTTAGGTGTSAILSFTTP